MELPQPGELFEGKHQIDSVLGEGAFGRVYAATTIATRRPVAIKVLLPDEGGYAIDRARRFLREIRAIAQLTHPNTLTLYEFGQTDSGLLYMVSELVGGDDLSQLIARRRFSERECSIVLQQVLGSLLEAHEAGLLHRDIKPDNIRVFEYGGNPLYTKLLDFGIAKSMDPDQVGLTGTGRSIGTPRYMSPEQIFGEQLTPATDIYSVGIVALEMLFGRTGFDPNQVLRGELPAELRTLSPQMQAALYGMLHATVSERFQSCDEAIVALRAPKRSSAPPAVAMPPPKRIAPAVSRYTTEAGPASSPRVSRTALIGLCVAISAMIASALVMSGPAPEEPLAYRRPISESVVRPSDDVAIAALGEDAGTPDLENTEQVGKSGCGRKPVSKMRSGYISGGVGGTWTAYVPRGYDPNHKYPVVVLLHHYMDKQRSFVGSSGFDRVADEEGFIVLTTRHRYERVGKEDDALAAIEFAVKGVDDTLCVDRDRIFAVGNDQSSHLAEALRCSVWATGVAAVLAPETRRVRSNKSCKRKVPFIAISRGSGSPRTDTLEATQLERNLCAAEPTVVFEHPEGVCESWKCKVPVARCRYRSEAFPPVAKYHDEAYADEFFPTARRVWAFFSKLSPTTEAP